MKILQNASGPFRARIESCKSTHDKPRKRLELKLEHDNPKGLELLVTALHTPRDDIEYNIGVTALLALIEAAEKYKCALPAQNAIRTATDHLASGDISQQPIKLFYLAYQLRQSQLFSRVTDYLVKYARCGALQRLEQYDPNKIPAKIYGNCSPKDKRPYQLTIVVLCRVHESRSKGFEG